MISFSIHFYFFPCLMEYTLIKRELVIYSCPFTCIGWLVHHIDCGVARCYNCVLTTERGRDSNDNFKSVILYNLSNSNVESLISGANILPSCCRDIVSLPKSVKLLNSKLTVSIPILWYFVFLLKCKM